MKKQGEKEILNHAPEPHHPIGHDYSSGLDYRAGAEPNCLTPSVVQIQAQEDPALFITRRLPLDAPQIGSGFLVFIFHGSGVFCAVRAVEASRAHMYAFHCHQTGVNSLFASAPWHPELTKEKKKATGSLQTASPEPIIDLGGGGGGEKACAENTTN